MNEVDWIILAVLGISTIVGLFRGIVRELMAIVGWVLAIVLALKFSPAVGPLIPLESVDISIRIVFGAILIVVVVLFVCGILGKMAGRALSAASITFEDRSIGAVFGFLRGVVVVCACVFLLGMTSTTRTGYWRNSVLIVPAERVIDLAMPILPEAIGQMRQNFRIY
jgi:membrane protein required for colicin V production